MDADGNPEIKDFSLKVSTHRFKFNGDEVYEAPAVIPFDALTNLGKMSGRFTNITTMEPDKLVELLGEVFDGILLPDSARRLKDRLTDRENSIDVMRQVIPALNWLLEEYGLRPTEPSPPSSTGPSDGGTSSTAGAPPEASTP